MWGQSWINLININPSWQHWQIEGGKKASIYPLTSFKFQVTCTGAQNYKMPRYLRYTKQNKHQAYLSDSEAEMDW